MSTTTLVTADQLLRMPRDGSRYELIAGELKKMPPSGWIHGDTGGRLHSLLGYHVLRNNLGKIFFAETGFLLARDPDTVRGADIAFIRRDHLPKTPPKEAFWPGAPDLAVEVVSPGDTLAEIDEKVRTWLDAGATAVWVVNPNWRNVTVYRSVAEIQVLTEKDELSDDDIVPGFRCRVGEIFANN